MGNKSKKTRNIIGIALGILIVLVAWSMVTAMGSKEEPEPDDNKHCLVHGNCNGQQRRTGTGRQ
jgi:flagellar basal body-associated protein FliL